MMILLMTLAMAGTLSVPSRTNANVSLAAAGRVVVAVWAATTSAGQSDVFAAVSKDSGTTFAAPVRVNSTEGDARTNGEQPPHVVLVRKAGAVPEIVVVWTTQGQSGTTLLTARSKDGGKTFGRSALVPGSDAPGVRGWEAASAGSSGVVHAVWLDHRAMAPPPGTPAGTHVHGAGVADGFAMAQRSSVYTSILGQPQSIREVAKGVCFCCKTAIVTGADGTVYAAWRNVYPGSIRDIATSISRDGGRTFSAPVKVSDDNWEMNACPDDGPAMAIDGASRLHIVWPTLVTDSKGAQSLALFYATSSDGKTFTPRQPLPTEGVPHHPQIAVDSSGRATIAWDETGRGPRHVVVATVSAGQGTARISRSGALGEGTYPVLAPTSEGVAIAWTAGPDGQGVVRVQRLPLQ